MKLAYRSLLLASVVSLAIAISAISVAEKDPSEEITEARQESQILTTIELSPHLDDKDLKVTVKGGVATLTGKVNEDIKKELAQQIALGVDGIDEVDNQIKVDPDYRSPTPSGETGSREAVDDETIISDVKSKLLWSKHAQDLSVEVEANSGKVTLLGTANSQEAREMAGTLAGNTDGVESVDNKITVDEEEDSKIDRTNDEPDSLGQRISDTWITTKVKSTLRYSSNVNAADISVSTKDGVVTLSGRVPSSAEHTMAIELTKSVRGVSHVDAEALHHQ